VAPPVIPRIAACLLLASSAIACGDDHVGPDPSPARTCAAAGGVTHTGAVGNALWQARDNPHLVPASLNVTGTLTIEPGTLICAGPDAAIVITSLDAMIDARGTVAAQIVFTATDPAHPWAGIHSAAPCTATPCVPAPGVISNARIEHARQGVVAGEFIRLDSVHFRQIRCTAARVQHIARSRVDSAGLDGCAAVELGISASHGGLDTFEDNIIRGSAGDGLAVQWFGQASADPTGSVAILGGRIEGSAGVGLRFDAHYHGGDVSAARPVRITATGGVPVWAPLDAVAMIWPTTGAQDSLGGNAADTAVVWGHPAGVSEIVLGPAVVWQTRTNFQIPLVQWTDDVVLRLAPGARLDLRESLRATGAFIARGTIDAPVSITGAGSIVLECDPSEPQCDRGSRIVNARLDGVQLTSHQHIVLDSVHAQRVRLEIGGAASRVLNTTVEDGLGPAFLVLSDVSVSDCIVRNNAFYGIIVYESATNVTIRNCVFEANRNAGVWNVGPALLDARFNWWGDPAGPLGPDGDGVEGNVDYSSHLTAPPGTVTAQYQDVRDAQGDRRPVPRVFHATSIR
jgi:parallel beta-helix repeat protein